MRLLIFTLILTGSLLAADFSTRYDVDVGMFGKVGYADVTLKKDENSYEMMLVAITTGTAATLTGKRVDTFISKGRIVEGRYLPQSFVKIKKTTREEKIQTYNFDHNEKKIILTQEKNEWVSTTKFDTISFKLVKTDIKKSSTENSTLDTYNEDDLLSSYLNAIKSCNAKQKEYSLLAVGAHNEDQDITLSFLDGVEKTEMAESFSNEIGNLYKLHVEPIATEDKTVDVLIAFDNDGHMKEALLGDIFWIGEVKAKRIYHRVTSN